MKPENSAGHPIQGWPLFSAVFFAWVYRDRGLRMFLFYDYIIWETLMKAFPLRKSQARLSTAIFSDPAGGFKETRI